MCSSDLIHSVNAIIDSKQFQCMWGTFSQCYLMVANAPPGTEAAVFDVDAAFRNIPTHPSVCPFLAVSLSGSIHLDHCLNFGASPCPGVWGCIADAMVDIFHAKGITSVIKWVDDFVFFRYPLPNSSNGTPQFLYDETQLWNIAKPLGWPWLLKKCFPFATTFAYIGFSWNLITKTVSLPNAKKTKYLLKLTHWTLTFKPTCEEIESLIGTFNHINLILPEGKTRMIHLYKLQASFHHARSRWTWHRLSAAALEDLLWWRSKLQEPFIGLQVITPHRVMTTSMSTLPPCGA